MLTYSVIVAESGDRDAERVESDAIRSEDEARAFAVQCAKVFGHVELATFGGSVIVYERVTKEGRFIAD